MKFYMFKCSNGLVYEIPLGVIIRNKAEYALSKNWFPELNITQCYQQIETEFERDREEIEDWAVNNMDWDDVKEFAKLIPSVERKINMNDEWIHTNAIKIVEHD